MSGCGENWGGQNTGEYSEINVKIPYDLDSDF